MMAPEGYVYVKVETGVSDNDYIAVTSGLQAGDTVAYDADAISAATAQLCRRTRVNCYECTD